MVNIFLICCYTGTYHSNVDNVINKFSNIHSIKILIVNQSVNKFLTKQFTNVYEEFVGPIGVSAARNIGIKWANKNKNILTTNYIYFWDEDIDIPNSLISKFEDGSLNNYEVDAYLFRIESHTKKRVGNIPYHTHLFISLNAYRLGNPHFIFNLNKINILFNENIGPGKTTLIAAEDTLFILQNNFKCFILLNDRFIHPEPDSINSIEKVFQYSIAQGAILRKLSLKQKVVFSFLIIIRPLIGFIVNPKNYKLYSLRIKGFIYGIKKDIDF